MPASGGVQRAAQPGQLVRTQAGQPAGTPRTLSDPADGMSRRLTFSDSSIANREPAGMTDLNSSSTETTTSPRRHRRPAEAGPGACCFPGRRLLLVIAGPEHRQAGRYRDGRHGAADREPRPDARAGRPGTRRGPASTRRRTRSPSPAARCRSPLLTRVRPSYYRWLRRVICTADQRVRVFVNPHAAGTGRRASRAAGHDDSAAVAAVDPRRYRRHAGAPGCG
jgi:hypothetical protein